MGVIIAKQKYPFWKPFFALFIFGFIGAISLLFNIIPQVDQISELQPELAAIPVQLIIALQLLQVIFLVIIATAVGCLLAPRVGLVSFIYEKAAYEKPVLSRLKPQLLLALSLGLVFSVVAIVLDMAFLNFMGEEFLALELQGANIFAQLGLGILYGGITEELLLRWGFMTFLVWLGWLLIRRKGSYPPVSLVWTAIILSAIVFGIGHLPAMASLVPLNAIIIIRTVLLNAIGGVVFGWLFWRYSLETAMIAHAFTHVGFFIAGLLAMV
ncbi:CPBP family intramembrane glutamic endopeptidase [Natranaerofaba carboxydovora]|uniref:CPBP family intramembrane glutamic endopeptidase n=1 Tax=Natranaerofaba carboxydovora TaxID=2742683 RepID=UPI001F13E7C4|nr:CPBP family intramembrane glutamic endopeptidase [Natranaerofaba carboxydovora]UMZ74386.1 CAAX protease self-immunity [Natranaerofaba carboxydovora]